MDMCWRVYTCMDISHILSYEEIHIGAIVCFRNSDPSTFPTKVVKWNNKIYSKVYCL
jgi:hypothetical protein